MKASKNVFLFLVLLILASCFDEPEFSVVPKIRFVKVIFGKSNRVDKPDSLVVELTFEDGDGNLGIGPTEYNEPLHELNYFLHSNGNVNAIGTREIYNNLPEFLSVPASANGRLVIHRTRKEIDTLPAYSPPPNCFDWDVNWRIDSVLINEPDIRIIPAGVTPRIIRSTNPQFPPVYIVKDTFYVQRNEFYSNIDVAFFRKPNQNSPFVRVDWYEQLCGQDFSGRFPILSDDENALSGTIKYSMPSTGWEFAMGTGIWQLQIRIRDRALNTSNIVFSPEFTLAEITQ